jgi:hypothetical protein
MNEILRDCRKWLAGQVEHLARFIYRGEHREVIEIRDEHDICRARVQIASDEYAHGIDSAREELPSDWHLRWYKDGERWQ